MTTNFTGADIENVFNLCMGIYTNLLMDSINKKITFDDIKKSIKDEKHSKI